LVLVKPYAKKPGWFRVAELLADQVRGLPGVKYDGMGAVVNGVASLGEMIVHQSHLPLINHPDAQNFLGSTGGLQSAWEARNKWAAERGFTPRVTQHQAVDFITERPGALLGDDMRLGKTLSALMSHDPSLGRLVVVAPLSTRAVWLGWMRRVFGADADIGVVIGRKYDEAVLSKPFVFGHYDIIHKWQALIDIGTLVLDETHLIANKDSQRSQAALTLRMRAKRVIAMTGTPIWNLPPNLWNIAGLIAPGAWGSYHEFCARYGAPVSTGYGIKYTGLSNEAELRARLSEVMLRRRWVDCQADLPPITRTVVVADLDQATRNKLDILAAQLKADRSSTIGNLASYRRQLTGIKLPTVVAEAKKIMSRGQPVVIWTWHKDFAELITKAIPRALLMHGEINPDEREHRMQLWRDSKTPEALVSTMSVGQVGIDLSHASETIFAEIDYTPAIVGQAEMRTFMATRPMSITFVVANHIVDQRIVRALVHKLSASDPLGVAAAVDSIDALRDAVLGPRDDGDLDRLLEDLLASQG
jgi:hypothetical protein